VALSCVNSPEPDWEVQFHAVSVQFRNWEVRSDLRGKASDVRSSSHYYAAKRSID